jgi:hypothetical protein
VEIEVNGNTYFVGQMKSRQQRNVLRRVLPLVVASKPLLSQLSKMLGSATVRDAETGELEISDDVASSEADDLFEAAGPIANALSNMADEQFNYVCDNCLGVVKRKVPGGLQDITISSGDLRFEDISLPQQMQLIFAVLRENFGDFFGGSPGTLNGAPVPGVTSN